MKKLVSTAGNKRAAQALPGTLSPQAPSTPATVGARGFTEHCSEAVLSAALQPVNIALSAMSRRYALFAWFLANAPAKGVARVGELRAIHTAQHAARSVPAYRDFLGRHGGRTAKTWTLDLPWTDKAGYINAYTAADRCVGGRIPLRNVAIDESSGSTGTPYNWLRSAEERHVSHVSVSHFTRYCFGSRP